jgi:hypothetical protein
MNVILRNSTRRMIDQSRVSVEAEGFIAWLRTDGYTDYVIDCHIRRLLFVLPKLSSGTAPPTLRDADLVAVFGRERRPQRNGEHPISGGAWADVAGPNAELHARAP